MYVLTKTVVVTPLVPYNVLVYRLTVSCLAGKAWNIKSSNTISQTDASSTKYMSYEYECADVCAASTGAEYVINTNRMCVDWRYGT
jgi:hypothetical protein